jgi:3-hydroxyacyl-[acyl-carrier-protein] dehydratase
MPPVLLIDIDRIDLTQTVFDAQAIEQFNPQRGPMRHLDGICWAQADHPEYGLSAVGYKDCTADEFWVDGHIPGRPLLPGVLMIETAAQLAAFMIKHFRKEPGFLGFLGCDKVKFRGQVQPGQRLYIVGHEISYRPGRRFVCATQGLCDGELVYEGQITGMPF